MFDWLKNRVRETGLTAIGLQAEGVCLVRVDHNGARPRLRACEFEVASPENYAPVLAGLMQRHHLKHARCTTVLGEGDYQLLLTETPEVGTDELKQALRWKIKDLIDFHINDATLDVFDLPPSSDGAPRREMYAVASRNEAIQQRVDLLTGAGIGLEIIDIPELAQRNLAGLLPEDAGGVVLLSIGARGGLITITRQGYLYLSRPITFGADTLRSADDPARYFDHIVLEVQRSLDYYESHFREAPVRHLALTPQLMPVAGLIDYLRANLGVSVTEMDLGGLLDSDVDLNAELQARCLTAIGAALRQETVVL